VCCRNTGKVAAKNGNVVHFESVVLVTYDRVDLCLWFSCQDRLVIRCWKRMTEAEVRLNKQTLLSLSNIVLGMERGVSRGCAEDIFQPPQAGSSAH
jgi:hypothetical protein